MVHGSVSLMRRPVINVVLIDAEGLDRVAEANVDTGFSGDLTLPKAVIEQLGLVPIGRSDSYWIGSGATATFDTYEATIRWLGSIRRVDVLESEIFPVIGVNLLWDNNLSIDFKLGGDVTITELPTP